MKFHLLAVILLGFCGYLIYVLFSDLSSEFKEARPQVIREAVKNAPTQKKDKAVAKFINKNIEKKSEAPKKPEKKMKTASQRKTSVAPKRVSATSLDFQEQTSPSGLDLFCRKRPGRLRRAPIQCNFPNACFQCESDIIPPEIESAKPLCEDGTSPKAFHIACCPTYDGETATCPSAEECFYQKYSPDQHCSCGASEDCFLVNRKGKVECSCR